MPSTFGNSAVAPVLLGASAGAEPTLGRRRWLELPDVLVVLANGPIRGEFTAARGVEEAHAYSAVAISEDRRRPRLGIGVAATVSDRHPGIMRAEHRLEDRFEDTRPFKIKPAVS
jgi:hypothetical protein